MSSLEKALSARFSVDAAAAALGDQQGQAIKQQIGRARRLRRRRRGQGGLSCPAQTVGRETARVHGGGERFEVGLAGQPGIERFEAFRGLEQQWWNVATALDANAICPRSRSTQACCSSSSGPGSAVASSLSAASNAPAWALACAAVKARAERCAGSSPHLREQPAQGLALLPAAPQHHTAPLRRIPRHRRTGPALSTPPSPGRQARGAG